MSSSEHIHTWTIDAVADERWPERDDTFRTVVRCSTCGKSDTDSRKA